MEINLNSGGFGNMGVMRDAGNADAIGTTPETKDAAGIDARQDKRGTLAFGHVSNGLVSAEPVAAVPDAALVRDDALGKLVNSAFNLPPPPMPDFT